MIVDEFIGKYTFLSNRYRIHVDLDGEQYPSVTHAIQAARTNDPHKRDRIRRANTPEVAVLFGRALVSRPGWHGERVDVMKALLADKFSYEDMAQKLIDTGDAELIEGSGNEDDFWGVFVFEDGSHRGHNWVGKILMDLRTVLRSPHA